MPNPKILSFGELIWANPEFLADFKSKNDVYTVKPTDREGTIKAVAKAVKDDGPFDGGIILMGNGAYDPFDADLFGPLAPQCKILACVNAGYSEFDLEWFSKNRIYVTNTIHAVAEPTADIAMFLILAVLRDTTRKEMNIRQGSWKDASAPPKDPNGLTLGIIGMGSIGKHVARKSKQFGMKVVYHNRSRIMLEEENRLGASYCSKIDDLLAISDVISLHCPLTDATRDLIGTEEIAKMKDGVFLINTSRGPVVNEKALIEALWSGKITRAGLDVFDNEPNINPFFRAAENCVVLPHVGSWTDVAWKNAYHECMNNVAAFFEKGVPISPVNKLE